MMNTISIIGVILTAIGTFITIYNTAKAKKYRDEIREDRQKIFLIDFKSILISTRNECKKITTPVLKQQRGFDPQKSLDEIQNLVDKMKEYSHNINLIEYENYIKRIENHIGRYKIESDPTERCKIGDKLYKELSDLGGFVAKSIDNKI